LKILVSKYGDWNKKLDTELDVARKFIDQVTKGKQNVVMHGGTHIETIRAENQCLKSEIHLLKSRLGRKQA
jgi:hypothetical protein